MKYNHHINKYLHKMNVINPQSRFKFLITLFLLLTVKTSPIFAQYTESTNIANDGIICSGDAITIDSGVAGATAYAWSDGGGVAQTASYNPSSNTIYTVTITNGGSTSTSEFEVTVLPIPMPSIISGGSPDLAFCSGSSIVLQVIIPNIVDTYQWSDGTSGDLFNFANVITVAQAGIYTVTVTNPLGCSATATVEVTEYPIPTATSNSPISLGGNLNLMEIGGTATAWQWSGPNSFTSTLQNPTISNVATNEIGTYTVTVTNPTGCTGTANTIVMVNFNVPTLSEWGLLNLALFLMICGTLYLLHPLSKLKGE